MSPVNLALHLALIRAVKGIIAAWEKWVEDKRQEYEHK